MTKSKTINIEIYKVKNLPENFSKLINESVYEGYGFVKRTLEEWKSSKNDFNKTGESFYLAYVDEQLVGCCGINFDPYTDKEEIGRIRHLYVSPNYRKKGVGKALTLKCLDDAVLIFKFVRLRANQKTVDSFKFYESLGFERTSGDPYETHRIKTSI